MEDEFQETSKALTVAQEELRATQQELHLTLGFNYITISNPLS
jgi:hypothetical protein